MNECEWCGCKPKPKSRSEMSERIAMIQAMADESARRDTEASLQKEIEELRVKVRIAELRRDRNHLRDTLDSLENNKDHGLKDSIMAGRFFR